ncbi:MAG TPA: Ku protein [Methylophilaceae bacterium]
MPHSLWKGAISFGLVHIPVELYPSHNAAALDLDMLDKRDFAPIGYKRYNKVTGKDVKPEDIVKGYEYEKGEYVVLSDADIKKANVKSTQTIDIVCFVEVADISPLYFEQPYYLKPGKGGDKAYSLLRETLRQSAKIGIAQVVIRTKQHLAALMPVDDAIVLNILRYADEIRPAADLDLPAAGSSTISAKEIKLANSLVSEMTEKWDPAQFHDTFREDILAMVEKKIKAKQTHALTQPEETEQEVEPKPSNVVDLMELLKQSLGSKPKADDADLKTAPPKVASRK